jgi:protein-S-isoprenylcysteine O-methyltransferase Ste14
MSRSSIFFLVVIAPLLALLLAALGFATLATNPLGWFLLLTGLVYAIGAVLMYAIRKDRFGESALNGRIAYEERGELSFWFISVAIGFVFFASPVEYLYLPVHLTRNNWMILGGLGLVAMGIVVFISARRALGASYSGHIAVKSDQILVQGGPYHRIRHPAYAGYLLMALGISLGYSSLAGLIAVVGLLIPSIYFRIQVEEKSLCAHFGEAYHRYASHTKRLIPGIW